MICGPSASARDRRKGRTLLYMVPYLALALAGCDKEPTKLEKMAASANAPPPATSAAPAPPPKPSKPQISVDDGTILVGSDRIELGAPDARGRLAAALVGKPLVEGEELVVVAQRSAKMPRVSMLLDALRAAKAKAALVKTQARDKTTLELAVPFDATAKDCSAVGFIGKDSSISAWTVSGGTATRYARGMAGPDLTLGSAGVRKVAGACDASAWVVSADETVTWGLVVDLVSAVRSPGDAGVMRAQTLIVPSEAPVPGRKVKLP
ncbi:MAG: hypothetical protein R3B36_10210 [Polyangiaceae bacterium]